MGGGRRFRRDRGADGRSRLHADRGAARHSAADRRDRARREPAQRCDGARPLRRRDRCRGRRPVLVARGGMALGVGQRGGRRDRHRGGLSRRRSASGHPGSDAHRTRVAVGRLPRVYSGVTHRRFGSSRGRDERVLRHALRAAVARTGGPGSQPRNVAGADLRPQHDDLYLRRFTVARRVAKPAWDAVARAVVVGRRDERARHRHPDRVADGNHVSDRSLHPKLRGSASVAQLRADVVGRVPRRRFACGGTRHSAERGTRRPVPAPYVAHLSHVRRPSSRRSSDKARRFRSCNAGCASSPTNPTRKSKTGR